MANFFCKCYNHVSINHFISFSSWSPVLRCMHVYLKRLKWKDLCCEIAGEVEEINTGCINTILVNLMEGRNDWVKSKMQPEKKRWLTKCEATQLENRARWYGSGSLFKRVSKPTFSTSVAGIACLMTPRLLGKSLKRSDASNSACKLFKVLDSSSEMRVRGLDPWRRACSRQMQPNSAAAFSVIFFWISRT